jgi:hypothetical protein
MTDTRLQNPQTTTQHPIVSQIAGQLSRHRSGIVGTQFVAETSILEQAARRLQVILLHQHAAG